MQCQRTGRRDLGRRRENRSGNAEAQASRRAGCNTEGIGKTRNEERVIHLRREMQCGRMEKTQALAGPGADGVRSSAPGTVRDRYTASCARDAIRIWSSRRLLA